MGRNFFGLRGFKLNLSIGLIAGIDFLLFGYDQGVMGGLLTLPSFVKTFPQINTTEKSISNAELTHRSTIQGISVASYNLGCFVGAIICIKLGDILGRRKNIFLGSFIMIIGATLQASSFTLAHFIIGRIITGLGNGLNTSTVPMWQSETSKSHRRGQMVMVEGALITGGICLSYWLDFGFSFLEPSSISWRFPIAFQIIFAIIICAVVMKLPESPRWLIYRNRDAEAISVLAALSDLPESDVKIQAEYTAIKASVAEAKSTSVRDLFTMDKNRHFHRVVLGYVNQMFQQISGINLITYYAATIYEQYIHLDPMVSRILAAANGTEYFLASWIAVFIIEKVGRRKLMIFGGVGMTLSMVVLSITAKVGGTGPGIVAATFLFVFNTFFAIGWLGMTWLYPAEIVPLQIRAQSNALSTSANWIWNFAVVMITPVAFASIGYKTYVIFAVINGALILPVVYWFYPETAYRSLEEMDVIFRKTTSWLGVVKVAREEPHRYGKNGELLVPLEDVEDAVRELQAGVGTSSVSGDDEKGAVVKHG